MTPLVSFVVPCYRLGHYLAECVNSILNQTYQNLEVLIMDDCSPDNTPEIGQSFGDPRVRYIRNEPNLGHLRNYNKGIELARGKYLWLISADDVLRKPYALDRYVRLLEGHPSVTYVFSAGMGLQDKKETRVIHSHGERDQIFNGRQFLLSLLNANSVVAASGLARKSCYETISNFPLDMPWAGDWYLWCVFALYGSVGYCAEPLVNCRTHALNMTSILTGSVPRACWTEERMVYWRVKEKAREKGDWRVVRKCRHMLGHHYAADLERDSLECLSLTECSDEIRSLASGVKEAAYIESEVLSCLGDRYFSAKDYAAAASKYRDACRIRPSAVEARIKWMALANGNIGVVLRDVCRSLRNHLRTGNTQPSRPATEREL